MIEELSYSTVSNILDSWEKLRLIPDYEEVVGMQLFQKWVKYVSLILNIIIIIINRDFLLRITYLLSKDEDTHF